MRKGALLKAVTILIGFSVVRLLDAFLPIAFPGSAPQWLIVSTIAVKYGSATLLSHTVLRRYLATVAGK